MNMDDIKDHNDIKIIREIQLFIPIQNSVKKHIFYYQTLEKIVEKLKREIPKIEILKNEPELCLLVCILVENILPKKSGIDKKKLVINILEEVLHDLTDEEKRVYENQIQFDYDNKNFKKIPMWKYLLHNTGIMIHDFFFFKSIRITITEYTLHSSYTKSLIYKYHILQLLLFFL
jgi:hypothetical protein